MKAETDMIEIENLSVERGGQTIVHGVSTRLEGGRIHAIIGPNGTGKTTLLRAIFADLSIDRGVVRIGEKTISATGRKRLSDWREHIAYMPQDTGADVALTVLEVVVLGRLGKLSLHIDDETLEMAMDRLNQAGIGHLAGRDIASLSGGQRQMVLFAQVLMRQPKVMLLDEPVSALDLKHQVSLLDVVRRETRANDWVTLVVLHDLNLACQYADNLLVIADGTLQASGPPKEIMTPDLVNRTYGIHVEVLHDRRGNPVVQPVGNIHEISSEDEISPANEGMLA